MKTPPTPPITVDYMRQHLDELAREVAWLRSMVARQRERIGDHTDLLVLSRPAARPAPAWKRPL